MNTKIEESNFVEDWMPVIKLVFITAMIMIFFIYKPTHDLKDFDRLVNDHCEDKDVATLSVRYNVTGLSIGVECDMKQPSKARRVSETK